MARIAELLDSGSGVALHGRVAGRIDAVRPAADTMDDCVADFREAVARLEAFVDNR